MIDLSTLKKGDKVKFRCGGEVVVEDIRDEKSAIVYILASNTSEYMGYFTNGFYFYDRTTPFDIIEIIPAPFDWNTIEHGMAFNYKGVAADGIVYYIGQHLTDKSRVVVECRYTNGLHTIYDGVAIKNLTRAPENDIEVNP